MSTTTPVGTAPAVEASLTVDSIPYPWPYHGHLDPARCALLACLDRSWRPPGPGSDEADDRLGGLASALSGLGVTVVAVTRAPARRGGPHTPPGEGRHGTSPGGLPVDPDHTVEAGGTSAFFESPLDGLLRRLGRTDLILAGWGLEGPIHSTMRAANDRGYECLLAADSSVPEDPALVESACSMIQFSGGIFGAYAGTEAVLTAFFPAKRREP